MILHSRSTSHSQYEITTAMIKSTCTDLRVHHEWKLGRGTRTEAIEAFSGTRPGESCGYMPSLVYSLVWDFLLTSNGRNVSDDDCSVDLMTISSFMLVSKTAKNEFAACQGWSHCATALKQEAASKHQIITEYQEKGTKLTTTVPVDTTLVPIRFLTPLTENELNSSQSFLAKADYIRKVDARLVRIQMVLLPKACRLAAIACNRSRRVPSLFAYTSTLEQSIRDVERVVNIQPALLHIRGVIHDLINLDEE